MNDLKEQMEELMESIGKDGDANPPGDFVITTDTTGLDEEIDALMVSIREQLDSVTV